MPNFESSDLFPGIYRGIIVDSDDPDNYGRVRLKVPQVTGDTVTNWAWPVTGMISQTKYPYGSFYTAAGQAIGVNTPTLVTGWTEADVNRMYLDGSHVHVEETGDYFVQFSCMFTKSSANTGTADMWFRKNGVDVPYSNTRITLAGSGAEITMTVSLILDLDAGDYVELVSSASATNISLSSSPINTGPAVPGVIMTVNLVGKFKPRPDTGAWVAYEGGDPNFPLWIGVF